MAELNHTPLYDLHIELGAKMVPFAGYDMPVSYPLGVMKEHLQTRASAGLFDVSHMGQIRIPMSEIDKLEALMPQNIRELEENRQRYGFFTNDAGGILDDLMIANRGDHLFMVVNAACKAADIAHLKSHNVALEEIDDRALLALQGPKSEEVILRLGVDLGAMHFMDLCTAELIGQEAWISRSGYTGEDGFEISYPAAFAENLARRLLEDADVEAIGLGARDSLRLEAGLCLYGHDIDQATSPVAAGLVWAMQKRRREEGGFLGDRVIQNELKNGASYRRVGLLPEGRAPMREGTQIFASIDESEPIGAITSGGFGPSIGAPMAMGYVAREYCETGTTLWGELRGKRLKVSVEKLPFIPSQFKR